MRKRERKHEWLAQALKEAHVEHSSLADRLNLGKARVTEIITGTRAVKPLEIAIIAETIDWPEGEVIRRFTGRAPAAGTTELVGIVGAGAEIYPVTPETRGSLDRVPAVPGAPDAVAVVVRGDSMLPAYHDGDVIYYRRRHDGVTDDALNRECVVRLRDGRAFLKVLRRGSRKHLFHLESYNFSRLEDQAVEWASPVIFVMKAAAFIPRNS